MPKTRLGNSRGTAAEWVLDTFRGGLNTLVSQTKIKPDESPDLRNVSFTENGLPMKRLGSSRIRDTKTYASRMLGLASYYGTGATDYLYTVAATQLFYGSHATDAFIAVSGVSITNNTNTNFVVARKRLYIHNGVDPMQAVFDTGATNPTSGVVAKFGLYWKGRHIVAGNPSNPSRVYLSRSTDSSYFITTGTDGAGNDAAWFDVSPDDGDIVTGLAIFQNNLIVFKERSIYRAVPSDSTTGDFISHVDVVTRSVGCVAHRTIENVENDIYFLSRRGVFVLGNEPNFFDTIRTNEISAPIHDQISGITAQNFDKPTAIYHGYKFRLSIPFGGTTYNNRELVLDTRYGGWSVNTGLNVNAYTVFVDPSDSTEKLYFGDDNAGKVYQLETTNADAGATIPSYFKSATLDMGKPEITKFFVDTDVEFKNTFAQMTVDVYIDGEVYRSRTLNIGTTGQSNGIGVNTIESNVIGLDGAATTADASPTILKRIKLRKRGKNIAVKVTNNSTNETWTLLSLRGTYRPLSHNVFDSADKIS